MMMGMMGLGMILPLILFGVVVFALAGRIKFQQQGPTGTNQAPLETLQKRYANGDISREAYEQMRRDLDDISE